MKRFKLIICVIFLFVFCCGCWDKRELEDNTFAVLLGIDSIDGKDVCVTIAFPLTQLEGGKQGQGGSGGEYSVMTVKAPSLIEGLNMFGTKLSGPLSLFSIKTVVISEELAKTDMLRHVFSSWRYEQTRNTTNVLISRCSAAEFIGARVKNPAIDVLRQEELLLEQANGNAYYKPVQLLDLIINLKSNSADSIAMYGSATFSKDKKSDEKNTNNAEDEKIYTDISNPVKEGYFPGELPLMSDNAIQICGLVVFRGNKMVGAPDSSEAQTYSMLTGSKTRKILTLKDPLEDEGSIVVSVLPVKNSGIKSSIKEGVPVFDISVTLDCSIESLQSGVDYKNKENLEILTEYIKEICLKNMDDLIMKIQKEYNADILKLGDKLTRHFLTVDEWRSYNWPDRYQDAKINVNLSLKIDRA